LHDQGRYNNKCDIFALGCILYEVTTGQKLFPSDLATLQYSLNASPILWPESEPGTRLESLGKLAFAMLAVDPVMRPSAPEVKIGLHAIRKDLQVLTMTIFGFDSDQNPSAYAGSTLGYLIPNSVSIANIST